MAFFVHHVHQPRASKKCGTPSPGSHGCGWRCPTGSDSFKSCCGVFCCGSCASRVETIFSTARSHKPACIEYNAILLAANQRGGGGAKQDGDGAKQDGDKPPPTLQALIQRVFTPTDGATDLVPAAACLQAFDGQGFVAGMTLAPGTDELAAMKSIVEDNAQWTAFSATVGMNLLRATKFKTIIVSIA